MLKKLIFNGVLLTLSLTLVSSSIGLFGGVLLGVFSCNKLKNKYISKIINLYLLIVRGTPLYVQLLIIYFVLPEFLKIEISPFVAGFLALGINSMAYVCEIMRTGIDSIEIEQWQACQVLGYDQKGTLISIILPQTFKNIFPSLVNEFLTLLKDTSLISTIGVMEMTKIAATISAKTLNPISAYSSVAFFYLIITTFITLIAKYIEGKLDYDKN